MAQAKATKKKTKKAAKKRKGTAGGSKVDPKRLQKVEQMMAAGCTRRDIVIQIVKDFGVTDKTAYSYYLKVEAEWMSEGSQRKSYYRKKLLKELAQFKKAALATGKLSAGIQAIALECKIRDMFAPEEIIIHSPDAHPTESMTSGQIRSYIAEKRKERELLLAQVVAEPSAVH